MRKVAAEVERSRAARSNWLRDQVVASNTLDHLAARVVKDLVGGDPGADPRKERAVIAKDEAVELELPGSQRPDTGHIRPMSLV